jgi:hypothetical protein
MASSSEASVQDASSLSEKELLQLEMLQLENDHLRYASYLFSSSVLLNSMLDPVKVVHCSASCSTCCGWQWGYEPRWSGHAVRGQEWDAQTMQTLVTLPTRSVGTFNTRGALTAPCRHWVIVGTAFAIVQQLGRIAFFARQLFALLLFSMTHTNNKPAVRCGPCW